VRWTPCATPNPTATSDVAVDTQGGRGIQADRNVQGGRGIQAAAHVQGDGNTAFMIPVIFLNRGIHLTGLVQASGAPRPGGRRAVDAGRLPPLTWR